MDPDVETVRCVVLDYARELELPLTFRVIQEAMEADLLPVRSVVLHCTHERSCFLMLHYFQENFGTNYEIVRCLALYLERDA